MVEKQHSEIVVGGEAESASSEKESKKEELTSVFLIPYPKIVFLYPTYLAAIVAGICLSIWSPYTVDAAGIAVPTYAGHLAGLCFLTIFGLNLVVLSFDFPRTTSLTVFFFLVALGVGLWMLASSNPELLGAVGKTIAAINPVCNATFFFAFATIMTLIFVGVFIGVRFDYWEVRPNELLHHHGVLSDLKRYSAPQLRIEKEINDIFEYFLLGAGRLILHPKNESRSIVLDNVFFINAKERKITQILSALSVRVNSAD